MWNSASSVKVERHHGGYRIVKTYGMRNRLGHQVISDGEDFVCVGLSEDDGWVYVNEGDGEMDISVLFVLTR